MPDLLLLLGDEVAGTVSRLPGGKLTFTYDATYVDEHLPATPVSVSKPSAVKLAATSTGSPKHRWPNGYVI